MSQVAEKLRAEFKQVDLLVHSLAYGPEVTKPLLETTREGCVYVVHLLTTHPPLP